MFHFQEFRAHRMENQIFSRRCPGLLTQAESVRYLDAGPLYGKDGYSDYVARPQLTEEQYQKLIARPGTPAANLNQNLQFRTINGEKSSIPAARFGAI